MIARFPGTCACGCHRPFAAGEQVERRGTGWARAACAAPVSPGPTTGSSAGPEAGPAEILEVLARARAVAAAEARITAARERFLGRRSA